MKTDTLHHPVVRCAIVALQQGDATSWAALFAPDATLYDDGQPCDVRAFNRDAIGSERFTSIDRVENDGLAVYGQFHSSRWGTFRTYFKFHIDGEGRIARLDIGQA
ncbi:TPA: hypothetical protein ACUNF5_006370 [Burkholderia orbicola]|uniref:hypothetical protein n=1 Tax=Burkholderia orbicola TaxID=2978683 RepID=UPI002655E5F8|nr:hypothetical protein [Burkholderia orbicola]MDN7535404.1 hypothetical protein [Burkholderia orbicola]